MREWFGKDLDNGIGILPKMFAEDIENTLQKIELVGLMNYIKW